MEMERHIRSLANKMGSSSGKPPSTAHHSSASGQGIATLIVMIAVLTIIVMFCCFAAPGIRDLCKRYVFRTCVIDDPDRDNGSSAAESANTPTLILLPFGRMLVVNQRMLSQLRADQSAGVDFMELSANVIRAQRRGAGEITGSTPSILDSDTTSKGLSRQSLNYSPPTYEDIYGGDIGKNNKNSDLPPSYSELSLMFRGQVATLLVSRRSLTSDAINGQSPVQDIELREIAESHLISRNGALAFSEPNSDLDQSPVQGTKLCEITNSHPGSPTGALVSRMSPTSNNDQSAVQGIGLCEINSEPSSSNGSLRRSFACDTVQSPVQAIELSDITNSCQCSDDYGDAGAGGTNVNDSSHQETGQGNSRTDRNSVQICIESEEVNSVTGPKSPGSVATGSNFCTVPQETTNVLGSHEKTAVLLAIDLDRDRQCGVMEESAF